MVCHPGSEVPHVLTSAPLAALQVRVAMELGQLLGVHVAPAVQPVHVLTDGELHQADLVQLHQGHVGGGGEGLRRRWGGG